MFLDSSTNNFLITRNGNTTQGTISPYAENWSNYFDGTGDYLTVPNNAALQMDSGNFTVEFWINFSSIASYQTPFDKGYTGAGALLFQTGLGNGRMVIYAAGSAVITESGTAPTGTWIHYALVRNGSTLTLYRDGTSSGSTTNSTNFNNSSQLGIGANGVAPGGGSIGMYAINGYLSNVRVVKGTAVYTTAFTPPTQPLTNITETSLLTCQSATFIDNSTNRFAITAVGNSQPTFFNPFTVTYSTLQSYSPSVFGGSMYFDGSGDFLALPANNSFATGTGDFTIEGWIYVTDLSAIRCICGTRTTPDTTTGWNLAVLTNGSMQIYDNTGYAATGAGSVAVNTWCHFAFVRQSNVFYSYINGTQRASTANTRNWTQNTFWIGANGGSTEPFAGYMSDIRFVKGQALYTSNFVPSNQPLTAIQNTILLSNGTGAGIYDASTVNNLETVGDSRISVVQSKWSNTSMSFDGTGDYLLASPNINLEFGSGDFTIEFWMYRVGTGRMALYHGSFGTDWSIGIDISSVSPNTSNTIGIWASSNGSSWNLINSDSGGNGIGTLAVSQNTWTHIAFVRSGTTWMSFVNGVRDRNLTGISGSVVNRATSSKGIGVWFSTGSMSQFNGFINDFRVTKGVARYTANFTPPTTPLLTN
jgi:hypothetical protein